MATTLEDRIGEMSDALTMAEQLHEELSADSELTDATKIAEGIMGDLRCAETVETMEDFDLNLKLAHEKCEALVPVLVTARTQAKKLDLKETVEVIGEAKLMLKNLVRELNDQMTDEA